ncbi:hypothetical protein BTUL_0494g00010 [Botrytis tulipae]|uniref:Uncharacterized protein n=1 Tax=Botrytis tulipae TaxID=87230 RepID=A0A4Z1EBL5_9HELO|nr:hypothetical protein BTUL_0494g00010 [Botrytis tulipae]
MANFGPPARSATDIARRLTGHDKGAWSSWYEPGQDHLAYSEALQKSLQTKKHLQQTLLTTQYRSILTDDLTKLDGERVVKIIAQESKAYDAKQEIRSKWRGRLSESATALSRLTVNLSSYIDPLIPQSPEYKVPYACIMIIFKGIVSKSEKRDEATTLFTTLQNDLPGMRLRADLFPTDEMKRALAEVYIDCLDLLWRLAKYFTMHSLMVGSSYELNKVFMDATATSLHSLRRTVDNLETIIGTQATNQLSTLLSTWGDQISDTTEELQLWQSPKLKIAPKNRWTVNGILRCLEEWQRLKRNSILWVSSKHDGHDCWMTEFCLDLILASTSQEQTLTFAMCDRPGSIVWTPVLVVKELISRLLQRHPSLVFEAPEFLNVRAFKRAKTFEKVFQIFETIVVRLESVFIVIDRIDCCRQDKQHHIGAKLLESLSRLVTRYGRKVRIIITCAKDIPTNLLPPLAISYFTVDTRNKSRKVASKNDIQPIIPSIPSTSSGSLPDD